MNDWWERHGPNYESGQEKNKEHNEGQKDGSKADWVDKIAHRMVGSGRGDDYDRGWENGEQNQKSSDYSGSKSPPKKESASEGQTGGSGKKEEKRAASHADNSSRSSYYYGNTEDFLLPTAATLGFVILLIGGGFVFIVVFGVSLFSGNGTITSGSKSMGGESRGTSRLANGTEILNKDSNGVGGLKYVSAKVLNVRSGPGLNYPIVRKAFKGDQILIYGEPEIINGEYWSVSIGDNPETRGWVNLKYISDNTYSSDKTYSEPNENDSSDSYGTRENSQSQRSGNPDPTPQIVKSREQPRYEPTPNDYNSPENRQRREDAEEARKNDPKLKQEAIEHERKRQQELQKTFDRLMKNPPSKQN